MMGGTIEIRTEPGKGTEFIIRVALRVQPEHHRAERIAELGEGLKALVVDDDFSTCDSVTKMLVRVGMRSEWTLSGKGLSSGPGSPWIWGTRSTPISSTGVCRI